MARCFCRLGEIDFRKISSLEDFSDVDRNFQTPIRFHERERVCVRMSMHSRLRSRVDIDRNFQTSVVAHERESRSRRDYRRIRDSRIDIDWGFSDID